MEVYVKLVNPKDQNALQSVRLSEEYDVSQYDKLYKTIQEVFCLEPGRFTLLSYSGVKLTPWSLIESGDVVQVCPTVLGGKGGFGSLLRAFGKQITMSTNKDACRDLTGRRIKQVNNEKKMREFLEKQAELAKQKEEAKLEKRKRRRKKLDKIEESTTGRHMFVDPKYDEQKQKIAQDLEDALGRGITAKKQQPQEQLNEEITVSEDRKTIEIASATVATCSSVLIKEKREKIEETQTKNKSNIDSKLIDWMGVGDVEVSSSSDEEQDEPAKNMHDDGDMPCLSAETFKALQEFYAEKEASEKSLDEDWQLSQFWYDKATSERLSKEVLTNALNAFKTGETSYNVACISCPTLFKSLHHYVRELKSHPDLTDFASYSDRIDVKLFEYDKRFHMYGQDFLFYDYKNPLAIETAFHQYFDFIISDPPYLSDECHVKTGMTIKKIGKTNHKLLICTGAIMEDLLSACFKVKLSAFVPRHERNLANEFKCYSNYETLFLD